jgi:hypothetical protein
VARVIPINKSARGTRLSPGSLTGRNAKETDPISVNFNLNGKPVTSQVESDTPLLWVIRDELASTG